MGKSNESKNLADKNENSLSGTGNFIHQFINDDLNGDGSKLMTRFPPEPNGYLHIGHAKSVCLNFGLASLYKGKCNLRFDDTNPSKEDVEYVNSIKEDIKWLGYDWEDRLYFASDYFEQLFEFAIILIKKSLAYVCELTPEEMREYRGTLSEAGKESPYRNRGIEENLELFHKMRNGEFEDGKVTLRAKVDMNSSNINMRDPVIYRIARMHHHNTGDKWCIYPMYDFAHPLEDAIEGITHSICTLEFEDHRPIYDWFVQNVGFENPPRQIEFNKLRLTNTIMGKRYLRKLVEDGVVDGWNDPRMVTLSGIRRRGYTPSSIRSFCEKIGVSKADSIVDFALLEHCVRDDLKSKAISIMAVVNPIKVIITNYSENETELVSIENNSEKLELGTREVIFEREIYIEKEDFMEEPPKKFNRLTLDQEVRLKGAYFIKCTDVVKDEAGNIIQINATYDKETKSGSGFTGRKVKGTIHWVSANHNQNAQVRLYESLTIDDERSETGYKDNPNSLQIVENCKIEKGLDYKDFEARYQFVRNGFYCLDTNCSVANAPVFNRIVSLRSSYSN